MRRFLHGLGALALAVASQAISANVPAIAGFFDFFLIIAVYYAVTEPKVSGMLVGAACGLVQDALFASILGLNAFTKALLGYSIGVLNTKVLLQTTSARLLVLAVATPLHMFVVYGLHLVLGLEAELPAGHALVLETLGNVLLGGALYGALRRRAERMR